MNDTQKQILVEIGLENLKLLNRRVGYLISGLNRSIIDLDNNYLKVSIEQLQKEILEVLDRNILSIENIKQTFEGLK